jgi:outer membrane receptor protein involved in Fe transport
LGSPVPFRVDNYQSFDLQAGYTFASSSKSWLRGLQFQVGCNNVMNDYPPLIPSEGNQSHDINAYDPLGRFYYIQAKYKF